MPNRREHAHPDQQRQQRQRRPLPHEQRRYQRHRRQEHVRQKHDLVAVISLRELLDQDHTEPAGQCRHQRRQMPHAQRRNPRPQDDQRANKPDRQRRPAARAHGFTEKENGRQRAEQWRQERDRRHLADGNFRQCIKPAQHRTQRHQTPPAIHRQLRCIEQRPAAKIEQRREHEHRKQIAEEQDLERMHSCDRQRLGTRHQPGEGRHRKNDQQRPGQRIVVRQRFRRDGLGDRHEAE